MYDKFLKEETEERGIPDYNLFPFHIYSHHDPTGSFSVSHHWHDEIELLYIEEGELQIQLNGAQAIAKAGEVYFINSQNLHQITALSPSSLHHAIVFKAEILKFEFYDFSQTQYLIPLIQQQLKFSHHVEAFPQITALIINEFNEIIDSYQKKALGWPIAVKASLLKIFSILIKESLFTYVPLSFTQDNHKLLLAKKVMSYIQENHSKKLTIEELAQISNMSPQYFCKFFKSMFGVTTIEYLNEHRIEQACQLLKQTDKKIMDIAFHVGFDNFSYFIRKFKALKNLTPSEYRMATKKTPNTNQCC